MAPPGNGRSSYRTPTAYHDADEEHWAVSSTKPGPSEERPKLEHMSSDFLGPYQYEPLSEYQGSPQHEQHEHEHLQAVMGFQDIFNDPEFTEDQLSMRYSVSGAQVGTEQLYPLSAHQEDSPYWQVQPMQPRQPTPTSMPQPRPTNHGDPMWSTGSNSPMGQMNPHAQPAYQEHDSMTAQSSHAVVNAVGDFSSQPCPPDSSTFAKANNSKSQKFGTAPLPYAQNDGAVASNILVPNSRRPRAPSADATQSHIGTLEYFHNTLPMITNAPSSIKTTGTAEEQGDEFRRNHTRATCEKMAKEMAGILDQIGSSLKSFRKAKISMRRTDDHFQSIADELLAQVEGLKQESSCSHEDSQTHGAGFESFNLAMTARRSRLTTIRMKLDTAAEAVEQCSDSLSQQTVEPNPPRIGNVWPVRSVPGAPRDGPHFGRRRAGKSQQTKQSK